MKITTFVLLFILFAIPVFADEAIIPTSNGRFAVRWQYLGFQQARTVGDFYVYMVQQGSAVAATPSQAHWECIKMALSRYSGIKRGHSFKIEISPYEEGVGATNVYTFICEFTSDNLTYDYWFFFMSLSY